MTGRPGLRNMNNIVGLQYAVLDHGFVRLVDYMGSDDAIVQAARVSYGKGTTTVREDAQLIDYLMRNRHSSPFEMCEAKFHIKLPIFVARQWIRHRTANVNEVSARYSEVEDEYYVPETIEAQSRTNRQGRGEPLDDDLQRLGITLIGDASEGANVVYSTLLGNDTARELARVVLPVNYYTSWYWKIDLHNLFHFLKLRTDPHAQAEIRRYADIIEQIVQQWVPMAWRAWQRHVRDAVTLSSEEVLTVRRMIHGERDFTFESTGLSVKDMDRLRRKLGLRSSDG